MRSAIILSVLFAIILGSVSADLYMHSLRGSNNRLNEASATRANNNRLFDTQNNARGGVNVGEYTSTPSPNGATTTNKYPAIGYNIKETEAQQYPETYYEGSKITMAWTNQHSCGGNPSNDPQNAHCNLVIQYTCDGGHLDPALVVSLTNGANTNTPDTLAGAPTTTNANAAKSNNDANGRGRHENELYYAECENRRRNGGLFIADQNVGNNAKNTRQNPGGNRSGLECPEERDYYPYWGPTPWRDIAYLSSEIGNINIDPCKMATQQSQNVAKKFKCVPANRDDAATVAAQIAPITQEECTTAGGNWVGHSWGIPAPDCQAAQWTRDNHLGSNRDGRYQNYTWTLPTFSEIQTGTGGTITGDVVKCVVRMRYNITTGDYDPWNTFSESNGANSPVTNNPTVSIGASQPLKLALNTAQTGRTFQDRSHVFTIRRRPSSLNGAYIQNLLVIGKRGNVVQTYPSVEYYWMPEQPQLKVGQWLHIQWTGSNTHNNGPNGGDGQTGDAGQGQTGTDRNNWVLTYGEGFNWALPLDTQDKTFFDYVTCYRPNGATKDIIELDKKSCAIILATSGHYTTPALADSHSGAWNSQMNNSPPSLINGILLKVNKAGFFTFMSSRNNNFTNRSQKGALTVKQ